MAVTGRDQLDYKALFLPAIGKDSEVTEIYQKTLIIIIVTGFSCLEISHKKLLYSFYLLFHAFQVF